MNKGIFGKRILMATVFLFSVNETRLGAQNSSTPTVSGYQTNKNISIKEFPTHKLEYAIPNDWKISENWEETKQTNNWWVPQYLISISSPDIHVNTKWPHPVGKVFSSGPGVEIIIISYGSNNASSAEEWYKSRLYKTFPEVEHWGTIRYEDSLKRYTKTKFAGQDAYCTSFENELDENYSNELAPEYSNCFILFGNLIYSISTRTNDQAPNYPDDVNQLKLILRSMKFFQ